MQSSLVFNGICIYVATYFAFCALSCELLSFRFFYYTSHCIVLWTTVFSCFFIILFIVLSCELLSVRVFYYSVHCIVLWTTVFSCLLLYCSLYCPVNYCLVVSFIILFIVLSCELLWCGTIIRLNVGVYFLTLPFL
jgi:hypothetical protein